MNKDMETVRNLVAWFNHLDYHKEFKGTYLAMMDVMMDGREPEHSHDVEYEILCFKVKKEKFNEELINKINDLIDE